MSIGTKIKAFLGIFILLLIFVTIYRYETRNIIEAQVVKVYISKLYFPLSGSIDEKSKKIIEEDPSNYVCVVYRIRTSNKSNYSITGIDINPVLSNSLKNKVLWYDPIEGPTESVLTLSPTKTKVLHRTLIARRDQLNDNQLIELFKPVKFDVYYYSFNNKGTFIKWLTTGYSKSESE